MIAFVLPFLAAATTDLSCGASVVSANVPALQLRDRQGQVAVTLPVKDNSLPGPLTVKNCGPTRVLVEYQGQLYVADRWAVVLDQNTRIICFSKTGGAEGSGTNGHMQATDDVKCKEPAVKPVTAVKAATPAIGDRKSKAR